MDNILIWIFFQFVLGSFTGFFMYRKVRISSMGLIGCTFGAVLGQCIAIELFDLIFDPVRFLAYVSSILFGIYLGGQFSYLWSLSQKNMQFKKRGRGK